jgi:chromosome segregation ATPase
VTDCVNEINNLRHLFPDEFEEEPLLNPTTVTTSALVEAVETIVGLASDYTILNAASTKIEKTAEKLKQKAGTDKCICCRQQMDTTTIIIYKENLKKLISVSKISLSDADLERIRMDASQLKTKVMNLDKSLLPLQGLENDIENSQSQITNLKARLNGLNEKEATLKSNFNQLESSNSIYEKAHTPLSEIRNRWQSLTGRLNELTERKRRFNQHNSMILSGGSSSDNDRNRSLEEIEELQRKRAEKKDVLQAKKDKLINEEGNLTKKYYQIKAILGEKEKHYLEAMTRNKRYMDLEESIKVQQQQLSESIEGDVRQLYHKKEDQTRLLEACHGKLKTAHTEHKEKEKLFISKLNEAKNANNSVQRLIQNVISSEEKCTKSDLKNLNEQMENLLFEVTAKDEEIKQIAPQMAVLNTELASQEHTKKQVTSPYAQSSYFYLCIYLTPHSSSYHHHHHH